MYYVHKLEVHQVWGGPEEGGWWYDQESALSPKDREYMAPIAFPTEEGATHECQARNAGERARRETLRREYTSVLSYEETFYTYDVLESAEFTPAPRPHYE